MNNSFQSKKNKQAHATQFLGNIRRSLHDHPLFLFVPILISTVAGIWFLLSHFYILRDVVEKDWIQRSRYEDLRGNVSRMDEELDVLRKELLLKREQLVVAKEGEIKSSVLEILAKERSQLADRIDLLQIEYFDISKNIAVSKISRDFGGIYSFTPTVITKEMIERSKHISKAKDGSLVIDDPQIIKDPQQDVYALILEKNLPEGYVLDVPCDEKNDLRHNEYIKAAKQVAERDVLNERLQSLREQLKVIDEQISTLASKANR